MMMLLLEGWVCRVKLFHPFESRDFRISPMGGSVLKLICTMVPPVNSMLRMGPFSLTKTSALATNRMLVPIKYKYLLPIKSMFSLFRNRISNAQCLRMGRFEPHLIENFSDADGRDHRNQKT